MFDINANMGLLKSLCIWFLKVHISILKVNGIIWIYQELETDIYICTGTYKLLYFWANWLKTCSGMNAPQLQKTSHKLQLLMTSMGFFCQDLPFPKLPTAQKYKRVRNKAPIFDNKHIMKHACPSQMTLMHYIFAEYFP